MRGIYYSTPPKEEGGSFRGRPQEGFTKKSANITIFWEGTLRPALQSCVYVEVREANKRETDKTVKKFSSDKLRAQTIMTVLGLCSWNKRIERSSIKFSAREVHTTAFSLLQTASPSLAVKCVQKLLFSLFMMTPAEKHRLGEARWRTA